MTDKLFSPVKRNLPGSGTPGQIIYDNSSNSFYGWNGGEWISFEGGGGGGFERVTGSIVNPNLQTSLIQGGGGGLLTEWGAQVSGTEEDFSLFFNQAALNNLDHSLVGVITDSDPVFVYAGDGSLAFTLAHYGPTINNIFLKYSSTGEPTLVGNVFSVDFDPFVYNYSVGLNDGNYSVVNGLQASTIEICDGSNNPVAVLPGTGIFLITYTPSNSFNWATLISGDLEVSGVPFQTWNCAIADNNKVIASGGFNGTINIYNSDGASFTVLSDSNPGVFISKYGDNGFIEWVIKVTSVDSFPTIAPCDMNNNEACVLASSSSSDILAYNFDETPSGTLETEGFSGLSGVFRYTPSGTLQWSSAIRSNGGNDITDIKILDNGDVFACGEYYNDELYIYNFDGALALSLPSSGTADIFLIKWSSIGEVEWTARIAGIDSEYFATIDVNDSGTVVITGYYDSDPLYIFNSLDEIAATLGAGNIFVVSYNNNGDVLSAAKMNASISGLLAAPSGINNLGNIIVSGAFFENFVAFNSDGSIGVTLSYTGSSEYDVDAFLVKYNSATQVFLGNPLNDGQEKIIAVSGAVILNTASSIENDTNTLFLNTFDCVELMWDASESNWIVLNNKGAIL